MGKRSDDNDKPTRDVLDSVLPQLLRQPHALVPDTISLIGSLRRRGVFVSRIALSAVLEAMLFDAGAASSKPM